MGAARPRGVSDAKGCSARVGGKRTDAVVAGGDRGAVGWPLVSDAGVSRRRIGARFPTPAASDVGMAAFASSATRSGLCRGDAGSPGRESISGQRTGVLDRLLRQPIRHGIDSRWAGGRGLGFPGRLLLQQGHRNGGAGPPLSSDPRSLPGGFCRGSVMHRSSPSFCSPEERAGWRRWPKR